MHDGFRLSEAPTAHPALWGHDAKEVTSLRQAPNAFLSPLDKPKRGRPLRKVEDLWPLAGRVMIAERLWLNTQRLAAVRVDKDCLSNVWWPLALNPGPRPASRQKAIVLWLNSTPGTLLLASRMLQTRGPWVCFKKPTLGALPVLDIETLSPRKLKGLASAFDRIARQEVAPLPQASTDPVRARIDAAICKALGLPDMGVLRALLAQEPMISLRRL